VDGFALDRSILDDVDEVVDLPMVLVTHLGVEKFSDPEDGRFKDMEEFVERQPELMGVVGRELVIQRNAIEWCGMRRNEHEKICVDPVEQPGGVFAFEVGYITPQDSLKVCREDGGSLDRWGEHHLDVDPRRQVATDECPKPLGPLPRGSDTGGHIGRKRLGEVGEIGDGI
jgi:hypothetical protein